jgi:hypothetical protein
VIIHNNNQTNNIQTNNTQNIVQNISLVAFGKEDLSKIDIKEIIKNINGFETPRNLTKHIHFNDKYPENKNVYITNLRSKHGQYYDGGKWCTMSKEDLVEKIYDKKKELIEDLQEEIEDHESFLRMQVNGLHNWLNANDDIKKVKKTKENIEYLLYDHRDDVQKNAQKLLQNMEQCEQ